MRIKKILLIHGNEKAEHILMLVGGAIGLIWVVLHFGQNNLLIGANSKIYFSDLLYPLWYSTSCQM